MTFKKIPEELEMDVQKAAEAMKVNWMRRDQYMLPVQEGV